MARTLDPTPDRWLTIPQARLETGVSRRSIYNWLAAGTLVTKRTASGTLRILQSSLWRKDQPKSLKHLSHIALVHALSKIPLDRDDRPYVQEAIRRLRQLERQRRQNILDELMQP